MNNFKFKFFIFISISFPSSPLSIFTYVSCFVNFILNYKLSILCFLICWLIFCISFHIFSYYLSFLLHMPYLSFILALPLFPPMQLPFSPFRSQLFIHTWFLSIYKAISIPVSHYIVVIFMFIIMYVRFSNTNFSLLTPFFFLLYKKILNISFLNSCKGSFYCVVYLYLSVNSATIRRSK